MKSNRCCVLRTGWVFQNPVLRLPGRACSGELRSAPGECGSVDQWMARVMCLHISLCGVAILALGWLPVWIGTRAHAWVHAFVYMFGHSGGPMQGEIPGFCVVWRRIYKYS